VSARRVVIVGGGSAWLFATRARGGVPANVVLIDKRNYHLFRPKARAIAVSAFRGHSSGTPFTRSSQHFPAPMRMSEF
jgi:NADH dehydrogenase FAD-containing subunit